MSLSVLFPFEGMVLLFTFLSFIFSIRLRKLVFSILSTLIKSVSFVFNGLNVILSLQFKSILFFVKSLTGIYFDSGINLLLVSIILFKLGENIFF